MSKNKNAARNVSNKVAPKPPTAKAPATLGTKGAAVKPSEIEISEDDDDDEDEEIEVGGTGSKIRKSQKIKLIHRLLMAKKQLDRLTDKVSATPNMSSALNSGIEALRTAIAQAEELSEDWRRPAAHNQVKSFNKDEKVKISETRRSSYEGMVDDEDLEGGLVVIKQVEKKVSVRGASGARYFFPAWHLTKA